MVTSWADGKQKSLDLFIEPRRGLTRELLSHAGAADSRLVLFGGPHGVSAPVGECETLVMITSDFGIAAHLPYLKQLIHGYNARKLRARRVHLVWQLSNIGKFRTDRSPILRLTSSDIGIAAQPLLNSALDDDRIDQGYVCDLLSSLLFFLLTSRIDSLHFDLPRVWRHA